VNERAGMLRHRGGASAAGQEGEEGEEDAGHFLLACFYARAKQTVDVPVLEDSGNPSF